MKHVDPFSRLIGRKDKCNVTEALFDVPTVLFICFVSCSKREEIDWKMVTAAATTTAAKTAAPTTAATAAATVTTRAAVMSWE